MAQLEWHSLISNTELYYGNFIKNLEKEENNSRTVIWTPCFNHAIGQHKYRKSTIYKNLYLILEWWLHPGNLVSTWKLYLSVEKHDKIRTFWQILEILVKLAAGSKFQNCLKKNTSTRKYIWVKIVTSFWFKNLTVSHA